ncbi:MAG: hypothetical protein RL268_62 [Pseudomonadota bacterium]|jgi:hypothetical protein
MSALTCAANDEDSDTIDQLRAENARLRQALLALHDTMEMTARAGAAHARAAAEMARVLRPARIRLAESLRSMVEVETSPDSGLVDDLEALLLIESEQDLLDQIDEALGRSGEAI